ncbi:MAG TPA: phasin family protein, partial [Stellaceae bacterium]|nr:phasin family protein [Stellaceae bacterium]
LALAQQAVAREPESPGALPAPQEDQDLRAPDRDPLTALAAAQTALYRGIEALSAEFAELAHAELDSAARAASGLLAARTLSDAVALQADYARSSLGAAVVGSARLSALGAALAAEAALPLAVQFADTCMGAMRRGD